MKINHRSRLWDWIGYGLIAVAVLYALALVGLLTLLATLSALGWLTRP